MQCYKNQAMPYMQCRQMQPVQPVVHRDTCEDMVLAMAYVPWQTWRDIYDVEKALCVGTIFSELDLPFKGKGGVLR